MTVNEIRNNIVYNENLIDQYYAEKRTIEAQIDELEQLRNKFNTVQNKFGEKQGKRKQELSKNSFMTVSNKIFTKYLSGMSSLLEGNQFNNAYNGLSLAKEKVNKEIQELTQKRSDCEERISYRKNRKGYWQEQLRIALAEANS